MSFIQAHVCDVCGKQKPASTQGYRDTETVPEGWYGVRRSRAYTVGLACSLTCLREWPAPKPAPVKKATGTKKKATARRG